MSNERTIDELIDAFNAQAQAEGRYDSRAFWEVPSRAGSIRDVVETDKSKEDLAWLRARRLAKEKAGARSRSKVTSQETRSTPLAENSGEALDTQLASESQQFG